MSVPRNGCELKNPLAPDWMQTPNDLNLLNDKVWLEDVMLHNSSHSREGLSLQEAIAESPNGLLLFCLQFVLRSDGEARFAEKFTWVENSQVLKTETVERDW